MYISGCAETDFKKQTGNGENKFNKRTSKGETGTPLMYTPLYLFLNSGKICDSKFLTSRAGPRS